MAFSSPSHLCVYSISNAVLLQQVKAPPDSELGTQQRCVNSYQTEMTAFSVLDL
jgi:hypothetical protein